MSKILVTYATRAGSTLEVATLVAEVLRTTGATVDVTYVRVVHELKGYDAVVIGSPIRKGRWLPEAVEFVKKNREALSHITSAYFLVSGFLRKDTPGMKQRALAYLDPVRKILEPQSLGLFAGKMDYSTLDWTDRSIAEAVSSTEGDWLDWKAIRSWAHDLLPAFSRVMASQSKGAEV